MPSVGSASSIAARAKASSNSSRSASLHSDSGSASAFLVRLIDAKDPPPGAFSPRDYADFLMAEILGGPKGGRALGAAAGVERVEGLLPFLMKRYFVEFDWLREVYELDPNQPIEIRK